MEGELMKFDPEEVCKKFKENLNTYESFEEILE